MLRRDRIIIPNPHAPQPPGPSTRFNNISLPISIQPEDIAAQLAEWAFDPAARPRSGSLLKVNGVRWDEMGMGGWRDGWW